MAGDWHLHKCETKRIVRCTDDLNAWQRYYCRCKHCGAIKKFDYEHAMSKRARDRGDKRDRWREPQDQQPREGLF